MTSRRTTAVVPYSAEQMFDLVADVERYPEFIPYCVGLRVVSDRTVDGQGLLVADMIVAYKVFRERFRSKVTLDTKAGRIDAIYVDGPFRHLNTQWRFETRPGGDCEITFEIDFEFRSLLMQATAQTVFEKAFLKMTDAFVSRADDVYEAALG